MRRLLLILSCALFGAEARASERLVEFYGPHPIDPQVDAGLCVIEGPHLHSYAPHDEVVYVSDGPYWTFVGDPTEFEPEPPSHHAYYGEHPIWWTHAPGEHYCYIVGPHSHAYAPPPGPSFTERGGAYWYVGARPAWYERGKHKRERVDTYYRAHRVLRPVVTVSPPTGWIGVTLGVDGVRASFGIDPGLPVVIERHPVIIEAPRHHPPAWGHHKQDPRFPGKHHGKDKHKHKHGGRDR